RYEIISLLARGGTASVWIGRQLGDRGFEKRVAIKTIRPDLAAQASFREMLLREAKIASSIDHPHVARILDLGERGDLLYLVMEWVDGFSLFELGKRVSPIANELGLRVVLRILADACGGLHAAHELCDAGG